MRHLLVKNNEAIFKYGVYLYNGSLNFTDEPIPLIGSENKVDDPKKFINKNKTIIEAEVKKLGFINTVFDFYWFFKYEKDKETKVIVFVYSPNIELNCFWFLSNMVKLENYSKNVALRFLGLSSRIENYNDTR